MIIVRQSYIYFVHYAEEYLAVLGVLGFLQMLLTVAFFLGIFVIVIKNFQKGRKHSHALRVCMYMIKRSKFEFIHCQAVHPQIHLPVQYGFFGML